MRPQAKSVMAPGIIFLAGNQPSSTPAAAADAGAEDGAANRRRTEDGERQPGAVSPPQTRTRAAAAGNNKESPRPDSPGYFTLSDSDGASNPGTELPQEDELKAGGNFNVRQQQQQRRPLQVYKMVKSQPRPLSASSAPRKAVPAPAPVRPSSDREKSKTPPRPSPPKGYYRRDSCDSDQRRMTPPRPPPPLSYTSTLPPPVPKKARSKTPTRTPTSPPAKASTHQQQFKTIPVVRRNSGASSGNNRKSSPAATALTLPRVQPLQMQSPSMINALTKSVSTTAEANPPLPPKERKSPPKEKAPLTPKKPKTFVQAFQNANHENSRNSPPRGKAPNITPRPTKTSTARATSSSRTSPCKDAASQPTSRSPSEPGTSSRRSSTASTKASTEALKKAVMKTLQVNGKQESKRKDKKGAASAGGGGEKEPKTLLEKIGTQSPKSKSPSSSPRRSSKSLSATAIEKMRERRNRSKDRKPEEEKREERTSCGIVPKKINSLIKRYENGAASGGKDDGDGGGRASDRSSGLSASQLSRLSQLSADELNSWLSSPMSSTNLDKSMTEIDVLDQCVSEMMSFTTDALTTDTDTDTLKSGMFLNMLEHQRTSTDDDGVKNSVQEIIDKIEAIEATRPPVKPERTRKRGRASAASPSDVDLSRGVFTEISFAGSFSSGAAVPEAPNVATEEAEEEEAAEEAEPPPPLPAKRGPAAKAPIPSPRTKRRARKEQMLLEHKQKGREALSILKSQSASCVPTDLGGARSPCAPAAVALASSTSHLDALECLEQLCTMSRGIGEFEGGLAVRRQAEPLTDFNCDADDAESCGAADKVQNDADMTVDKYVAVFFGKVHICRSLILGLH